MDTQIHKVANIYIDIDRYIDIYINENGYLRNTFIKHLFIFRYVIPKKDGVIQPRLVWDHV